MNKNMKITFPSLTAKQIVEKYNNKLGKGKLLYNTTWYEKEDFYTKEKCRKGTREIITYLTPTLSGTWDECKAMGEMLNFAELLWCVIEIPGFLKEWKYSWTSSRTSRGDFVRAGNFDDDGGDVSRLRPGYSNSNLGCAFFAVALKSSTIDPLKSDEASSLGARVKALEDWKAWVIKCMNEK